MRGGYLVTGFWRPPRLSECFRSILLSGWRIYFSLERKSPVSARRLQSPAALLLSGVCPDVCSADGIRTFVCSSAGWQLTDNNRTLSRWGSLSITDAHYTHTWANRLPVVTVVTWLDCAACVQPSEGTSPLRYVTVYVQSFSLSWHIYPAKVSRFNPAK